MDVIPLRLPLNIEKRRLIDRIFYICLCKNKMKLISWNMRCLRKRLIYSILIKEFLPFTVDATCNWRIIIIITSKLFKWLKLLLVQTRWEYCSEWKEYESNMFNADHEYNTTTRSFISIFPWQFFLKFTRNEVNWTNKIMTVDWIPWFCSLRFTHFVLSLA